MRSSGDHCPNERAICLGPVRAPGRRNRPDPSRCPARETSSACPVVGEPASRWSSSPACAPLVMPCRAGLAAATATAGPLLVPATALLAAAQRATAPLVTAPRGLGLGAV